MFEWNFLLLLLLFKVDLFKYDYSGCSGPAGVKFYIQLFFFLRFSFALLGVINLFHV